MFYFLKNNIFRYFLLVLCCRVLETYPDLLSDIFADTNDEQRRELGRILNSQTATQ